MIILGTNSIKDTGYNVDNSLRFNEGSSDTLTRTPSSAGNRRTWTYSAWHKPEAYSSAKAGRFLVAQTDSNNLVDFAYGDNGTLYLGIYEGGAWKEVITNAYNRDPSAWLHMVIAVDTTQGTDSNRVKVYVNGVHQTSLSRANYPSQNYETSLNNTVLHIMGSYTGNSIYYNGYMAEVCLIDGQALTPTSFGEFDEDSSIWKPKDFKDDVTFGTNGFYLDFEDSSALGNDVSGNNNDFTANNFTAVDQSTDTCTNNFATLNSLNPTNQGTLSEGNLKLVSSSAYKIGVSTIAVSSGKWYVEHKITGSTPDAMVGVIDVQDYQSNTNILYAGRDTNSVGYYKDGRKAIGNSFSSYGATYTTNDIIGIALDLDSGTKTITFYKNGASQGSINLPTAGSEEWYFLPSPYNATIEMNFGSPPYSESGGNSDGNGYGNFAGSVPSGYYALNTKNLAEYG